MDWIDSHSHHYLTSLSVLERLKAEGLSGVVEASWVPVRPSAPSTLVDLYEWVVRQERERLKKIGLMHYPAVGIHPRCIPNSGLEEALSNVERWLGEAKALGEVGLETGESDEVYVLEGQLKIALKEDKPVIMHTPRANKRAIAGKELQVINSLSFPQEMVVIDHVNPEIYDLVHGQKFYLGLSLQPGKLTVDEALKLVKGLDIERVLINSDSSTEASEPGWPALLVRKLTESGLESAARMIALENPSRFYRI